MKIKHASVIHNKVFLGIKLWLKNDQNSSLGPSFFRTSNESSSHFKNNLFHKYLDFYCFLDIWEKKPGADFFISLLGSFYLILMVTHDYECFLSTLPLCCFYKMCLLFEIWTIKIVDFWPFSNTLFSDIWVQIYYVYAYNFKNNFAL